MTTPSSTDVLTSLATHLDDIGLAVWSTTGYPATPALPAVFFERLPDKPERALALAAYNDDRTRDDTTPDYYIQIRGRAPGADPFRTHDLMDSIFDVLHDSSHSLWGTTPVLLCRRHIRGLVTPNTNATAWSRADSYTITVNPT